MHKMEGLKSKKIDQKLLKYLKNAVRHININKKNVLYLFTRLTNNKHIVRDFFLNHPQNICIDFMYAQCQTDKKNISGFS